MLGLPFFEGDTIS